MVNSPFSATAPATGLLAGLIAWCAPASALDWTLGPPPPLPPLPIDRAAHSTGGPLWELVAQRPRARWERVPSHERLLFNDIATGNHLESGELLAIAQGPASVELIQHDLPARRWELVEAPDSARAPSSRADRLEIMRLQPVAKVPVALVAEQPLGQQAIGAPCTVSLCNLRVMGRIWFRF